MPFSLGTYTSLGPNSTQELDLSNPLNLSLSGTLEPSLGNEGSLGGLLSSTDGSSFFGTGGLSGEGISIGEVTVPGNRPSDGLQTATGLDKGQAPFDPRLARSDMFVWDNLRMPFSADEAAPMLSDLIDITVDGKNNGHVVPASKKHYQDLVKNPNTWGTLSLINPYTVTRLYNGLGGLAVSGKYARAEVNRMLDIRDQKRFYDIHSKRKGGDILSGDGTSLRSTDVGDILSVSNPTPTNIIRLMNNDAWGRTPYSYQDFAYCSNFNKIPTNRLITLRKYASPTTDNLCWELMGADRNEEMKTKFAPIATMLTYFGGESGNTLKDILNFSSGLPWEEIQAQIWNVTGDAGDAGTGQWLENFIGSNGGGMLDQWPGIGRIGSKALAMAKFFGMTRSPNAFDGGAALTKKNMENLHDPNENGPYANRIKGPINRIDKVYKRKEGLVWDHKINLKFSYKAHALGGINSKAAMLDIMSNILLMCSATAVFWGGGNRFQIEPHAYPWTSTLSPGLMKDIYNGNLFGPKGAIRKTVQGFVNTGLDGNGNWSWDAAVKGLANLGVGILGVIGGAVNTIIGSISGKVADMVGGAVDKLANMVQSGTGSGDGMYEKGKAIFSNLMANGLEVWRSNAIKTSVLPHTEGLRAILIGTPVGNWHLTIGNPLNPIATIGNLICKDVKFEFGEELGPDDFPTELHCTVTLEHGMARDLAAIESMFNRGAGRIYQAPDYIRMFGGQASSDQETRVDEMTGNTSSRVPASFSRMGQYARHAGNTGHVEMSDGVTPPTNGDRQSRQIVTPLNNIDVIDYDHGVNATYSHKNASAEVGIRSRVMGNMMTRKYVDE